VCLWPSLSANSHSPGKYVLGEIRITHRGAGEVRKRVLEGGMREEVEGRRKEDSPGVSSNPAETC